MPAMDMPLPELKNYIGISPLPGDFDMFWTKALEILEEQAFDYDLYDAGFAAPGVLCNYLYFTGVGGARICCKFLRPENKKNLPGIIMFHGYSGDSGGWVDKLAYALSGYAVLAMDVRGQGGSSTDTLVTGGTTIRGHIIRGLSNYNPNDLFYRNVFLDTVHAARILMSMNCVNQHRIGATGWSQGGGLAIACAALEPRIKAIAPVYPFLCDYKRVWEMDLCRDAYDELAYFIRNFDPRHDNIDEMFETLGYIDVANLAAKVQAETYMLITLMDSICPPSTQFAAYNRIEAKKSCEIYPNHGHEGLPDAAELIYEFFNKIL